MDSSACVFNEDGDAMEQRMALQGHVRASRLSVFGAAGGVNLVLKGDSAFLDRDSSILRVLLWRLLKGAHR